MTHLSLNKMVKGISYRKWKKEKKIAKYFLGDDSENHWIVMTPNFEDYISWIQYAKDRFSLDNYVHKLSIKKGFKIQPMADRGVTKRDYRCHKSKGNEGSTNCPFELNFKKLVIEESDSENRFYLAYYRNLHNHPLEIESEQQANDKENESMVVLEDMKWLEKDQNKYYKMVSKIYGKKIEHSCWIEIDNLKKRELKSLIKTEKSEPPWITDLNSKISQAVNIIKKGYFSEIEEYIEREYKRAYYAKLLGKIISPPPIPEYTKYEFCEKFAWVSLPLEDELVDEEETIVIEDEKSSRSSSELGLSKIINEQSREKFVNNIGEEFTEDYSFND
jgi:hypothetical protein